MEAIIPNKELVYRDRIKKFVHEDLDPISLQVETSGEIPEVIVEKMRGLGLFGLSIPEKFGGLGLSTLGEILVAANDVAPAFKSDMLHGGIP